AQPARSDLRRRERAECAGPARRLARSRRALCSARDPGPARHRRRPACRRRRPGRRLRRAQDEHAAAASAVNLLRNLRGLWLILALALGLRLIPLGLVLANGGSPLIGDEGNYVQAAQSLAQDGGIPDLWVWIRPPGYIVFAAAVFWLAAGNLI